MLEDRRLAAIMFTDIVGYTALMGSDEDKAFEVIRKNLEIHTNLIQQFNGTLIKEMGDGMLISFHLASQAVRCAIAIQKACKEQEIPLKIGIHEGEMVFAGDDVMGDSVNIASRLQEDADEGSIGISSSVYKNIKNKSDINARFVGEKVFKNMDEPVKVYRVLGEGEELQPKVEEPKKSNKKYLYYMFAGVVIVIAAILIWNYLPQSNKAELDKSIAVLPLKYLSEDPGKQYLADGVMEEITGHLSKIEGLRVTPSTSVEQYRETTKTAGVIGEELNVSYLVNGSFFMIDNQVRLTIRLVTADEDHVWFEAYDRDWADIFTVQSEVAQTIAKEVKVVITPDVKDRIESIPTENKEAYDLFLRGSDFHDKGIENENDESDIKTALHFFNKAIELDPNFADAYVGKGWAIYVLNYSKENSGDTLRYFANKALAINPDLSDGYWMLSGYYNSKGDTENSIRQINKVLKINPNNAVAYLVIGVIKMDEGQYLESYKNLSKAKKMTVGSPDYPDVIDYIGSIYQQVGNFQKAEVAFEEFSEYRPSDGYGRLCWLSMMLNEPVKLKKHLDIMCEIDSVNCTFWLARYYMEVKDFHLAEIYLKRRMERDTLLLIDYHRYGYILDNLERKEEAKKYFEKQIKIDLAAIKLKNELEQYGSAYYDLAGTYAYTGEIEKAYQVLQDFESKGMDGWAVWIIQVDPLFESLWDDEEFKQMIQREEKKLAIIRAELDRMRGDEVL